MNKLPTPSLDYKPEAIEEVSLSCSVSDATIMYSMVGPDGVVLIEYKEYDAETFQTDFALVGISVIIGKGEFFTIETYAMKEGFENSDVGIYTVNLNQG